MINFETNTFDFSAYFDPVSKVSILLPSLVVSVSFHLQVSKTSIKKFQETPIYFECLEISVTGGLVFLAALFTGLSWRNIHQLKEELFARSMIR